MKNLIFIFLGFFCFANSQTDSINLEKKFEKVVQQNKEIVKKANDLARLDENNLTLIYKIKRVFRNLTHKKEREKLIIKELQNTRSILAKNINEPVVEIIIPDGFDTIRGSFFYRLFHKEKSYLRAFKLQDNEKIYLD